MSLVSAINNLKSFINPTNIQTLLARNGHQMCTRNTAGRPIKKRRGIKRGQNSTVHTGEKLVTQRTLKFHAGMNVGIDGQLNLVALVPGTVKISCEVFDPNFEDPRVIRFYQNREGQQMYKKYFNVIPFPLEGKFKLKEVV